MNFLGLDGRTVLITGAGGGIGRSLMQPFRSAGAIVFGADRKDVLLADLDLATLLHGAAQWRPEPAQRRRLHSDLGSPPCPSS